MKVRVLCIWDLFFIVRDSNFWFWILIVSGVGGLK